MQSHPAMPHDAPVLHVAGMHWPTGYCVPGVSGFAQTQTMFLPQSESTLQPWMHSHVAGTPPSGDVSSQ